MGNIEGKSLHHLVRHCFLTEMGMHQSVGLMEDSEACDKEALISAKARLDYNDGTYQLSPTTLHLMNTRESSSVRRQDCAG